MGTFSHAAQPDAGTPAVDTPTSVYRYYDQHKVLLYVGVTARGISRNREHNATKDWWQYVVSQEVDHYQTRDAALAQEKFLIQKHLPPFNTQHNPVADLLKAAYLGLALDEPTKSTKGVGTISLVHIYDFGINSYYRTELSDYSVAQRLTHRSAPVLHGTSANRLGFVCAVDWRGAVAVIKVKLTPRRPGPTAGRLEHLNNPQNDGGLLRIHRVRLGAFK